MKIIIKAVTDNARKGIQGVRDELEKVGKSGSGSSGKISMAMKAIGKSAAIAVTAITAVVGALVALGKSTIETQKEQAKLIAAFQSAGSTAKQAGETYKGLYRFLGDSSKAAEAANHLAQITTNQKDLAQWTKIAQGIYTTFGDSLPIEGLTEAANETIKVGKVTGTMADAVNWLGVSEDALNAKLAATTSLEEREALIRSTLNDLYSDAAEAYERNNKALLDYNESQASLDTTMAQAGAATLPLLTALNNLGSAFFTALKPALDAIIPPIAAFINMIAKAIQSVMSFFSALTGKSASIKAVADVGNGLKQAAGSAGDLAGGLGDAGSAAGGAKKAIEEAKKTTQGFDELNIVSSGKSAAGGGGSSGGGSGGGAGGGSGLIDTNTFKTEVEESESITNSLADNLKETFAKIAEVFAPSIEAWSSAFDTVKEAWNDAKPDFISGATQIKDGFVTLGTYLGNEFIPNVVNSFSTNFAPMIGDVTAFAVKEAGKQFDWLGKYFKNVVNDMLIPYLKTWEKVAKDTFNIVGKAWDKNGDTLLKSFSGTFDKMRGHLDNFYNSVFKPVWDKVIEVLNYVWDKGLKNLVEKFVDAYLVISTELSIFYNEVLAPIVDWIITNILPPIVDVLNGIVEALGKVIVYIADALGGVITVIKGVIQFLVGVFTGDWDKAWEGIKNIFKGFFEFFEGIINAWTALFEGICNLVKDVVVAAFRVSWETIKGIWSVVVDYFKKIWDGIKQAWSNVTDWFSDLFKNAWNGIKSAWSSVGTWFSNLWSGIKDTFSGVSNWFKGIFETAWTNIKNVFSGWGNFFSGLWNTISSTFGTLGTNLGNAISSSIKSGINGVISMIQSTINSGIGLINGAINLINKLPGVNVGKISKLSLPRLAEGGIVDTATIAMIGEAGKEAVVPLENNTEWMDKLADKLAAKTSTPSKIVLMLDGKELGWANINSINNITKQTGSLQLQLI